MKKSGKDNQNLGRFGEDKAVDYLISAGYTVLQRNFRCRLGEIDIIAQKDGFIAFIEVKLRKNSSYGTAAEFVGNAKQRRILLTAEFFLNSAAVLGQPRFDVIEIYAPYGENGALQINHIEDAFGC